jgi:hypothetical protein
MVGGDILTSIGGTLRVDSSTWMVGDDALTSVSGTLMADGSTGLLQKRFVVSADNWFLVPAKASNTICVFIFCVGCY